MYCTYNTYLYVLNKYDIYGIGIFFYKRDGLKVQSYTLFSKVGRFP